MATSARFGVIDGRDSAQLKPTPCFSSLSIWLAQTSKSANYFCSYPSGTTLFLEGQEANGLYLISKGQVKLTVTRSDGKSIILRIAEPGELIGLDCMVSSKTFGMTAETLGPCAMRFVPRDLLRSLMRDHPDVCMAVAEQLSNDYRSACSQIRSLGLSRSASERIVLFLLDWGARGRQTDQGLRVNIPLKHEEIAQIVGVSRETVTRTFTDLKHKHLIVMKGPALLIKNKSALEALTGGRSSSN